MTKGFGSQPQTSKASRQQSNAPIGGSLRDHRPIASIQGIQEKLCEYVSEIPDPRVARSQKHQLQDILVIAILAVIAGAEGWEDLEKD